MDDNSRLHLGAVYGLEAGQFCGKQLPEIEIHLAALRGFCSGVRRALDAVSDHSFSRRTGLCPAADRA